MIPDATIVIKLVHFANTLFNMLTDMTVLFHPYRGFLNIIVYSVLTHIQHSLLTIHL